MSGIPIYELNFDKFINEQLDKRGLFMIKKFYHSDFMDNDGKYLHNYVEVYASGDVVLLIWEVCENEGIQWLDKKYYEIRWVEGKESVKILGRRRKILEWEKTRTNLEKRLDELDMERLRVKYKYEFALIDIDRKIENVGKTVNILLYNPRESKL